MLACSHLVSILDYPLGGVELVGGGTDLDLLISELVVVPCRRILRFAGLVLLLLMITTMMIIVMVVVVNGSIILGEVNL